MADTLLTTAPAASAAVTTAETTAVTTAESVAQSSATQSQAATTATSAAAVPETYDLKAPTGVTLDAAFMERTAATARALGLDQDAAQRLLEHDAARVTEFAERQQAFLDAWKPGGTEWTKQQADWTQQAKADPDLGKTPEEFASNLERAQGALRRFGPELSDLLTATGYGSHPAVLKFFVRLGAASAESTLVPGGATVTAAAKSDAQVMYPAMYDDNGRPKV